ncbi:MAG: cobyrinate a,c-diamide synthase [Propionicimonas sp.]
MVNLPRLVVAAAASSAGKTTIATGLMGALRAAGQAVAGFKVGPDFIDPGYHAQATGRPGRNLDAVLTSETLIPRLLLHGATTPEPADIAIVEGVMGLFDGQLGRDGFGSTAHIARLIDAPVVLVVDAAGSSRTAAAAALGLRAFDERIRIAGVIVNRVASPRHSAELAAVFERVGMPVLGMVPRSPAISAPSRHLGLVPAAERPESADTLAALAAHIAQHVDLGAVQQLARAAAPLTASAWDPYDVISRVRGQPLVGLMAGRAFTFRYAETEELLRAAGCRIVEIDPLRAEHLPAGISALYIGGGFPEIHAVELSRNAALRASIAEAIADGLPTVAECAGQLYLGEHLDGHPMVGAVQAGARMAPRLTLGYRQTVAPSRTLLAEAGTVVTGHEFHRTQTEPTRGVAAAWSWDGRLEGFSADPAAGGQPSLHSSYLHVHWAGHPSCAQRFADAAAGFAAHTAGVHPTPRAAGRPDGIDLDHHGDHDLAPGLVDLAVNVMLPGPPAWLAAAIEAGMTELGSYPDASLARAAIAAAHGLPPRMVLPTAGAAEAFALIARTVQASHPLVVHPQFTEPEAALRAVGAAVQRWLLPVSATTPTLFDLPSWADAVFVGNPTNPTGWLHRRDDLLRAAGERLLVVDEAFMDATDEHESLIGPVMPNRLVVRSLSKTWGLAGLRVGYVVGDPTLITRLEQAQPPWPVSAPAIAAMIATSTGAALAEAAGLYRELDCHRQHLVAALTNAGFVSLPSSAPFVLIDTSPCGPGSVRTRLARAGFAVRRGESFPGLGPAWIRVRVPGPAVADAFVAALSRLRTDAVQPDSRSIDAAATP